MKTLLLKNPKEVICLCNDFNNEPCPTHQKEKDLEKENLKLKEEYENAKEYNKYLFREIKLLEQKLKVQKTIIESLKKCGLKKK